jgi:hypothetical protein
MLGNRWPHKPPLGYRIDRDHPLAQGMSAGWLLNEGTGQPLDQIGYRTLASGASGWSWSGNILHTNGTGYLTCTSPLAAIAPFSSLVRFRLSSGNSGTPGILSISSSPLNVEPLLLVQLNGSTSIRVLTGNSTLGYQVVTSTPTAGIWHTLVTTATATSGGTISQYLDGAQVASAAANYTLGGLTSTNIYLGMGFNGGTICDFDALFLYNQVLAPSDVQSLTVNPWQIVEPRRVLTYFGPLAAIGHRYVFSGPSGGFKGDASVNFTITPSLFVISDTVTLSDGGAGGTFSHTTLTWTNSAAAQTFTYTAAMLGPITITATSTGA